MKQRIVSALVGVLILVLVLIGNQAVFDIVVTLISVAAIYEVLGAVGLKENRMMTSIAVFLPVALMLTVNFISMEYMSSVIFLFISFILLVMLFSHPKYSFSKTAMFIAISVMISISFIHVALVRRLGNENLDVLVVLIGCWITDTCAYFTGMLCGKHKLAPQISPKKTIEGSIGGIIGVTIILTAYAHVIANIMGNITVNTLSAVIIGLVCGIISQFGDLCASIIKRENGVKDFGHIMPGHGGVMDRFDSFLFVAPTVYYILRFFPIFIK